MVIMQRTATSTLSQSLTDRATNRGTDMVFNLSTSQLSTLSGDPQDYVNETQPTHPPVYYASQEFMFVSLSLIIPLGLVFNTVAIGVFLFTPLRRRAGSWYLAALAFSDDLALLATLLEYWLKDKHIGVELVKSSHSMCVVITHLSYSSRLFSALMVTSFTVERFIGVVYPLRRATMSSRSHARWLIILEALGSILAASFTLFTIGVVDASYGTECDVIQDRYELYLVFNVVCIIFGSIILPIIIICSVNAFILQKLCRQTPPRRHFRSGKPGTAVRRTREFNMAVVVLTISSTFVVLNVPYCICWIVLFTNYFIYPFAPHAGSYLFAAKYFTSVPYYLNYAINFILYSLCSRAFRVELFKCLCCSHQGRWPQANSFKDQRMSVPENGVLLTAKTLTNPKVKTSQGLHHNPLRSIYQPLNLQKLFQRGPNSG